MENAHLDPVPAVNPIFIARGSADDQAKLLATIPKLFFPWDLLKPELQRQGRQGIICEYADLSAWGAPALTGDGGEHDRIHHVHDAHGNEGHILWLDMIPGPSGPEYANAVGGLAWRHGLIQVNQNYRNNQAVTDWVMSAEIAHMTDFFYIEPTGRVPALHALMHRGQQPPPGDVWWGGDYWKQGGEGWMAGFGVCYSDFVQPDSRFSHGIARDQIPEVWRLLNAPRTDQGGGGGGGTAPTITSYAPNPVAPNAIFAINGGGFASPATVIWGSTTLTVLNVTPNQIQARAPSLAGSSAVRVTVASQSVMGPVLFIQADQPVGGTPKVNTYVPNPVKVGQKVDIEGEWLTRDSLVTMNGIRLNVIGFATRPGTNPLWTTLAVQAPATPQNSAVTVAVPGKTPVSGPSLVVQNGEEPPPTGKTIKQITILFSDNSTQIIPVGGTET